MIMVNLGGGGGWGGGGGGVGLSPRGKLIWQRLNLAHVTRDEVRGSQRVLIVLCLLHFRLGIAQYASITALKATAMLLEGLTLMVLGRPMFMFCLSSKCWPNCIII